jgi:hypothetical protein
MDEWGSVPDRGKHGIFYLRHRFQAGSGARPVSYPTGNRGCYSGGKTAGYEANHSPPSTAEVKNACSCNSTLPFVFLAWCLVKYRDNFTYTDTYLILISAVSKHFPSPTLFFFVTLFCLCRSLFDVCRLLTREDVRDRWNTVTE